MRYSNPVLLNGVSAAVNQTSSAIDVSSMVAASAEAIVTGTSTGTLAIQASDDGVNFGSISESVSISGAGTYIIPKFDLSYLRLLAVFTASNGQSGTITVTLKTDGY